MSTTPRFRRIATRTVADVQFLSFQVHDIETPAGETVERIVITHPGAVAVVAVDGDDIILIEQYRAAAGGPVIEIPAGKIDDPTHSKHETAHRELIEETGFSAHSLTWLTEIWTTVGFTDERIAIYLAEGLTPGDREPVGAEESAATIVRMPFDEAVMHVREGTISDAKTVIGILLAADQRGPS